ncbi:TPA: putative DNA modification/repair radical SAM protein [Candidatus Ventrenecus avicola]|nr:putative DNA modification/repair radical SAM protein [Candidatus Ventrenecus avicola]
MTLKEKLEILADSAKYDASCSSSGSARKNKGGLGNGAISGICHSFSSDGRCISLLKILMTNCCVFDCKYCINRKSNVVKRAIFEPDEIAMLTVNFYKRNYIEGLFLSSGIIRDPDYTMEKMIEAISLLRNKYHFHGYIHAKAIPGASPILVQKLGRLVDRLSANIELPTENGLKLLAPDKNTSKVMDIMGLIKEKRGRNFTPAGQSTQMIIGATNESDLDILHQSSSLYQKYSLKRVFYSAYISVNKDKLLPVNQIPPLKRENRLYQADWLLRFYRFRVGDLLSPDQPNFNVLLDPKADWALRHMNEFPKEINKASYYELLRVPGIGPTSAKKIVSSRRYFTIHFSDLKKMGISLKRAKYFILCDGKYFANLSCFQKDFITQNLILEDRSESSFKATQLSLFHE